MGLQKFIIFTIGGRQMGRTARMNPDSVFKASEDKPTPIPTSDRSFSPAMPPELQQAIMREKHNEIGRLKWWQIDGWLKTFKKR